MVEPPRRVPLLVPDVETPYVKLKAVIGPRANRLDDEVVAVTVSAVALVDLAANSVDGNVQFDARTFDAVSLASLPGTRSSHISLQNKYSFRGLNP